METVLQPSRSKALSYIALSVALMAVCSWIAVPTAIPFTMQTFGVFAVLGLLGGRRGTAAIVCYLFVGLVGLPVFSSFTAGAGILFGTTGGYLIGFVFMGLIYWLLTALMGTKPWVMLLGMVLGLLLLYAFGSAWFLLVYLRTTGTVSLAAVLGWCVAPYILPDLIKLSLAMIVIQRLRPLLRL